MAKRKAVKVFSEDPADDQDFLVCLDYIKHVEFDHNTKESFAAKHGVDRSTVWQWQIKWKENGLLHKTRQYLGAVITEDILVANRQAAIAWNKLLDEQIRLATSAKSEFVRFQAIAWIYSQIVQPIMDEEPDPGSREREYLTIVTENPRFLNPHSVAESGEDEDDE